MVGDAAKKELVSTQVKLSLVEKKVVLKDSVITALTLQLTNLQSVDTNRLQQLYAYDRMTNRLETDLKKEKGIRKLYQASSGVLIVAVVILGIL